MVEDAALGNPNVYSDGQSSLLVPLCRFSPIVDFSVR